MSKDSLPTQQADSLAALVLRNESAKVFEAIGRRYSSSQQFIRSLKEIAESFRVTAFGKVVEAENLKVEALYTKQAQGAKSFLSLTLQEGISYYLSVPDFYFVEEDETVGFNEWHEWKTWQQEVPKLLRWLARTRQMLKDDIWLPEVE